MGNLFSGVWKPTAARLVALADALLLLDSSVPLKKRKVGGNVMDSAGGAAADSDDAQDEGEDCTVKPSAKNDAAEDEVSTMVQDFLSGRKQTVCLSKVDLPSFVQQNQFSLSFPEKVRSGHHMRSDHPVRVPQREAKPDELFLSTTAVVCCLLSDCLNLVNACS